jgi:hypothetical protein
MDAKIVVADADTSNDKKLDIIIGYENDPNIMPVEDDLLELCKINKFYTYFDSIQVNGFKFIQEFLTLMKEK